MTIKDSINIFFHNFNPASNSGPNKFTRQLFASLIQQTDHKVKPMLLRLDGIYFNSDQNYNEQNKPIKYAYENADAVVFQSEFNRKLTEAWFGPHKNGFVIHNAPDLDLIKRVNPHYFDSYFDRNIEIWCAASSWRPHKRLKENIRYFIDKAPKDAILCIAGAGAHESDFSGWSTDQLKRIKYLGNIDYLALLSLYRRSSTFIHLAYMDHCPNVVVDAQASGCKIICSSTGGTKEIVANGIIIKEKEWDFSPIKLYNPPKLDFNLSVDQSVNSNRSLLKCSMEYYNVIRSIL